MSYMLTGLTHMTGTSFSSAVLSFAGSVIRDDCVRFGRFFDLSIFNRFCKIQSFLDFTFLIRLSIFSYFRLISTYDLNDRRMERSCTRLELLKVDTFLFLF